MSATKIKRAAIYARVSTSEQSAEMQLVELRELAARRGWEISGEYVDEGISGTKASRPRLDKLMADARHRKFDLVLVWRFDRFALLHRTCCPRWRSFGISMLTSSR